MSLRYDEVRNIDQLWPNRYQVRTPPWPDGTAGLLWRVQNTELWLPDPDMAAARWPEVVDASKRKQQPTAAGTFG